MDDLFGSELKLDLSISEIEAGVTAYFQLANEIIIRNGVSELFADGDGVIWKCKVLEKLLPEHLLRKVKNEMEYRSSEIKSSVRNPFKGARN
ncbi:unnamed protein product [Phytophthora fragariaefolia]|uniref:Unnamed protein product n=1 Tax=Phytophthora fragariaefolia TaxID=1490495 RepID=A0A9W6YKQ1_9STRA|nr:unnamed protein product [Phytophthora fragariaefolia]